MYICKYIYTHTVYILTCIYMYMCVNKQNKQTILKQTNKQINDKKKKKNKNKTLDRSTALWWLAARQPASLEGPCLIRSKTIGKRDVNLSLSLVLSVCLSLPLSNTHTWRGGYGREPAAYASRRSGTTGHAGTSLGS